MREFEPLYVRALLKLLENCPFGTLSLKGPNGKTWHFKGEQLGIDADLEILHWGAIKAALSRGDIGFGEAYVQGLWISSNISNLVAYGIGNITHLKQYVNGSIFQRYGTYLINILFKKNTLSGSRHNIMSHYDLGNNFYELWLDPTMTYSSGLRYSGAEDLEQSQRQKYERILGKIRNQNTVLEIGCGWGGFAEKAAIEGHHVTSLTISPSQHIFSKERLGSTAKILLQDYRHTKGLFDSIVSIEMFEAVGEAYWPTYFKTIKNRLKKGGNALIQTITINDNEFKTYRKSSDYLRHYIFPGGMLPSSEKFEFHAKKAGLAVKDTFYFGQDYAWTLQEWEKRFCEAKSKIMKLGFNDEFIRNWLYYFGLCRGGFQMERISVMQVELIHEEEL